MIFPASVEIEFSVWSWSVRYPSVRDFNAAGADPDCEIGENHTHKNRTLFRSLSRQHAAGIRRSRFLVRITKRKIASQSEIMFINAI